MNDLFEVEEPIASIEMKRAELLKELADLGYSTVQIRKQQVEDLQASVDLARKECV